MTLAQITQQLKSRHSTVKPAQLAFALSVLIKHDLVSAMFRTTSTEFGAYTVATELTWTYSYTFNKRQCMLRLSLPRLLSNLTSCNKLHITVL